MGNEDASLTLVRQLVDQLSLGPDARAPRQPSGAPSTARPGLDLPVPRTPKSEHFEPWSRAAFSTLTLLGTLDQAHSAEAGPYIPAGSGPKRHPDPRRLS